MAEAHYLVDELRRRQHRLEVVLANRLMPTQLADGASARATAVSSHADSRVHALAKAEHAIAQVAARQGGALAEMDSWGTDVVLSESRSGDITDVGALLALGEALTLRQPGILSPRSGLASGNNGR